MIPPMVPSLVVHCINEIELRGMSEQGLYRVNGGLTEVKCLKEKFLKGKGAPNLSDVDISTICSTLKDFLRYVDSNILFYTSETIYLVSSLPLDRYESR